MLCIFEDGKKDIEKDTKHFSIVLVAAESTGLKSIYNKLRSMF